MDSFCRVEDSKAEESPASKIGFNAVVILSIAKASDFNTLKSLRLVSSFWLEVVSRVFTQRTSVKLTPGKKSLESLRSFKNNTKGLEGKIKVLRIYSESEVKPKFEEGIAFNDVIQQLSPYLETLDLAPQNFKYFTLLYPQIESNGQFPVLRTLILDNRGYDIPKLIPNFFEAMPRLEDLKLSNFSNPYDPNYPFVLSPLQNIGDDGAICRNWNLVPNLRSLTVKYPLSLPEMEGLAAFPQSWEALHLFCRNNHELYLPEVTAIEQILEKYKDSLRSLTLMDNGYKYLLQLHNPHLRFKFPSSFSKMKVLQLFLFGDFDHITFGRTKNLSEYAKICPMLELLSIYVHNKPGKNIKDFWAKFFPNFKYKENEKDFLWRLNREGSERWVNVEIGDLKEENDPAFKIGFNAVVLRSIAKFIDFDTLKTLRLVNIFWLQSFSRVFTQRASVNLKPGKRSLEFLHSFIKDTKGIEGKIKLLKINCNSETKLEFDESITFNGILLYLSSSLETLELAPQNFKFFILYRPLIDFIHQFPVLRTLVLSNEDYDINLLIPKLFEATPALENIELNRLAADPYNANTPFVLSPLTIKSEDGAILRNWNLAPNLRSLKLTEPISPIEAERLAAFPQRWETLAICWESGNEPVTSALEQLLNKNCHSLRCLYLKETVFQNWPKTATQFQFPTCFSKLKELRLFFVGQEFDHITFGFGQSKDLREYCTICPSLGSVSIFVYIKAEASLKEFWPKFFPESMYKNDDHYFSWEVEKGSEGWVMIKGRFMSGPSKNNNINNNI